MKEVIAGTRFLLSYLSRKTFCSYRPLVVMIEPTNECNLKCVMCPNEKMDTEKGFMSLDFYKNILDYNHDYIHRLELYLVGEPLLHPEIFEMIAYARNYGIWTRIYTNATLLNEEITRKLIGSELNAVTFSYEGLNKEGYEKIRRGALYENVHNNIESFIKIRRSLKSKSPSVTIKFIDFNYENEEIKQFKTEMKHLGVDSIDSVPLHGWPDKKRSKNKLLRNHAVQRKYYPCFMPWIVISISWDGNVLGCCDDYSRVYPIGNLHKTHYLKDLWNSSQMVTLRAKLAKKEYDDLPHCKHCDRIWKSPFRNAIYNNVLWNLRDWLFLRR